MLEPDGRDRPRLASPMRPLLAGDIIGDRRVLGFAWRPPHSDPPGTRSTHLDDRLLLEGDEPLTDPPDRPVPQGADGAQRLAALPPADLPKEWVTEADSVDPTIALRADALMDLPGTAWQPLARTLFAAVHATGHQIWLSGGTARDTVAGVPLRDVNDLDLSGTVPPGRFSDILYQSMRATRMAEFRTTVTPTSLVCAVIPPHSDHRLLEYRGLSQGGFNFPAVGSRLTEDARHRDLSFNSLIYDVLNHYVIDPGGNGLADLRAGRFRPLTRPADPVRVGRTLLRALKFGVRWRDRPLDLRPLADWIESLPPGLCAIVDPEQWKLLRRAYTKIDGAAEDQAEFAAKLPSPGRELLEALIGPAR